MKKLITVVAALTAFSVFSATQTSKEYVDAQDGELHDEITAHKENGSNPHGVTAAQVDAYSKDEADAKFVSQEADPTVPEWAKMPEPPRPDVSSVNLKTGDVTLDANDVGAYSKAETDAAIASATPGDYANVSNKAYSAVQEETDPNVPEWAKRVNKPDYAASEVGAYTQEQTDSAITAGDEEVKRVLRAEIISSIEPKTAFRGHFENEDSIPSSTDGYFADQKGRTIPNPMDLITVDSCEDPNVFSTNVTQTSIVSGSWKFVVGKNAIIAWSGRSIMRSSDGVQWTSGTLSFTPNRSAYGDGEAFVFSTSDGNMYYSKDDGRTFNFIMNVSGFNGGYISANTVGIIVVTVPATYTENQHVYWISTFGDKIECSGFSNDSLGNPSTIDNDWVYVPSTALGGYYRNQTAGSLRNFIRTSQSFYPTMFCGHGSNIICYSGSKIYYKSGSSWIQSNVTDFQYNNGCYCCSDNLFVGSTGNDLLISKDGITWQRYAISQSFKNCAYFKNNFYFSGTDGIWRLTHEKTSCIMRYVGTWGTDGKNGWKFASEIVDAKARASSQPPGNYASVSNRAMNAIQYGEVEPPGDYANVSNKAMTAMQPANTYNKDETDALIAANKPEYEDLASNVVWRIEADGARFFFKPVRPVHTED